MTTWFQTYKDLIQEYLALFIEEVDIGRDVTYKEYESSSFNTVTKQQEFTYTSHSVRTIKVDADAESNLGPLWVGIKNYRSQASGPVQTGDFQFMFNAADFPTSFTPSTKDLIVDGSDTVKVIKVDRVFGVAYLIVAEGSNVT